MNCESVNINLIRLIKSDYAVKHKSGKRKHTQLILKAFMKSMDEIKCSFKTNVTQNKFLDLLNY